jgi:hypothetical protein
LFLAERQPTIQLSERGESFVFATTFVHERKAA